MLSGRLVLNNNDGSSKGHQGGCIVCIRALLAICCSCPGHPTRPPACSLPLPPFSSSLSSNSPPTLSLPHPPLPSLNAPPPPLPFKKPPTPPDRFPDLSGLFQMSPTKFTCNFMLFSPKPVAVIMHSVLCSSLVITYFFIRDD